MELQYLPYEAKDLDYCNRLIEINMQVYFEAEDKKWDRARYARELAEGMVRIIYQKEEKVGFVHLSEEEKDGYIDVIQIEVKYRNQGIGNQILQWADGVFQKQGKEGIRLSVFKTSPALSLYERHGYEVIKDRGDKYLMRKVFR